ncbi:MAG TPA: hypothetical protein DIT01_07150 [Lentisphaeria bacterium]|jgi:drug/metabolite transporter (DMT)-like permease|nr:hypothetical protein [Lentisphaeria bacterium]|tara:strand:+ start:2745 stop:3593 length:849 start_codon:yes stop_codon:yes gene_type:complete
MITAAYIFVNAFLQTCNASTCRYISARSESSCVSATLSFFVSSLYCGVYFLYTGDRPETWGVVLATSAFTGIFYGASYLVVLATMKARGMAIALAVGNLSLFVPVVVGIGFGERLSAWQYLGLAMTAGAVPLLSLATVTGEGISERPSWKLITVFFVLQGCGMSGNLIADRVLPETSVASYLTILFFVAGCICLCACRWLPGQGRKSVVGPGMLQGVLGATSTLGIMLALNLVSATVFFCGISIVGLVLSVTVAVTVWRERLAARAWIGLALAAAAIVFLHL